MKRIGTLLIFVLLALFFTACGSARILKKADQKYEKGAYSAAIEQYKKAQKRIKSANRPLKAEINFKMGECYRRTGNYFRATTSYRSAIKYKYADPIIYLYNAECYQAQGNFVNAIDNYQLYLSSFPRDEFATKQMNGAMMASEALKIPSRYVVAPASFLNSRRNSDFSPTFVGSDVEQMVFSSNRNLDKKKKTKVEPSQVTGYAHFNLLTVKRDRDGKWSKPAKVENLNTEGDEGASCISADGKTMFFTRCVGGEQAAEILKSTRSGGEWGEPTAITLFTDSTITIAHPALNYTGDTLFFVSDAPNGKGGKDIWMCEKLDNGWGIPENLGNDINTKGDEMFPYVRKDGTLYFSSNGRGGLGGLDIFAAKRDTLGRWHVVVLGVPINSSADDFGIVFEPDKEAGYLSSTRNQRKPWDRIYRFELPDLEFVLVGKVTDERGHALPEAVVKLVGNDGTNTKIRCKRDGTFQVKLNKSTQYVMLGTCRGFLNSSAAVTTVGLDENKVFKQRFKLPSVSKTIKMDNILYEFAKWTLTKDSEKELNGLVKLMQDNPHITIEIAAHTDSVGSEASNLVLSQRRAQSVVNYLIKAGIEADRLTAVGYGESKPVVVDDDIAKEYKFLKKGDVLTPEFIDELEADEQEICNQMNRRTEFRVLRTTYNLY